MGVDRRVVTTIFARLYRCYFRGEGKWLKNNIRTITLVIISWVSCQPSGARVHAVVVVAQLRNFVILPTRGWKGRCLMLGTLTLGWIWSVSWVHWPGIIRSGHGAGDWYTLMKMEGYLISLKSGLEKWSYATGNAGRKSRG
jgi:hypothetical protein